MVGRISIDLLYRAGGDSGNNIVDPTPLVDGDQTAFTLISWVVDSGSDNKVWVDGVLGNTNLVSPTNANFDPGSCTTYLGGACFDIDPGAGVVPGLGHDPFAGGIAEVIIYAGALNDADRVAVEGYLQTYSPDPPPAGQFEWNADDLGNWNSSGSWTPPTEAPPNSPNNTAVFGSLTTVPTLVAVNNPFTVNRVEFNHTQSYVIGGHGSVSLAATKAGAPVLPTLSVTQGSHEFQAAVNLMSDTTATVASDSTLTFNNALNLMGHTLTKTGDGTLAINNQLTTAGGALNVQQGTVSRHGTIGGDVTNDGGTISPGDGASLLEANGVPEPSAMLLLLVGVLATFVVRIR